MARKSLFFKDLRPVILILPKEQEVRLAETAFRGRHLMLAGNFFRWDSSQEMLDDLELTQKLLELVQPGWDAGHRDTMSCTVEFEAPVGWASTDDRSKYDACDLEQFSPNKRSTALRIKPERKSIRAPLTDRATVVISLLKEERPTMLIRSIYPGPDIGVLQGDLTTEEGKIFFDWSQPGEFRV